MGNVAIDSIKKSKSENRASPKPITSSVKEFIASVKEDIALISFVKKYETVKKGNRKLSIKLARNYNNFILSFPYYWQILLKRYLDVIVSLIAVVVFSPVLGMVALAVKLTSKGPVIYRQERVGENGKTFIIYKFRTMRTDAEKSSGPMWARKDDPRITPIGKFLRKSHLDELPQLMNVLKGEMSVVGPRPERPHFVKQLKDAIPYYERRLHVKPGITGLAQVRHKYDETITDVKKKVKYDLVYIKKMCLMLDLRVIYWTIGVVFTGKGAR
jgi:exopolysaccharide biosynthesis polyprenyl glycosylphosphotransferase